MSSPEGTADLSQDFQSWAPSGPQTKARSLAGTITGFLYSATMADQPNRINLRQTHSQLIGQFCIQVTSAAVPLIHKMRSCAEV